MDTGILVVNPWRQRLWLELRVALAFLDAFVNNVDGRTSFVGVEGMRLDGGKDERVRSLVEVDWMDEDKDQEKVMMLRKDCA